MSNQAGGAMAPTPRRQDAASALGTVEEQDELERMSATLEKALTRMGVRTPSDLARATEELKVLEQEAGALDAALKEGQTVGALAKVREIHKRVTARIENMKHRAMRASHIVDRWHKGPSRLMRHHPLPRVHALSDDELDE